MCGRSTSRTSITTCARCMNPVRHKKSAEVADEISRNVQFAREDIAQMLADAERGMPKKLPKPRPKPTGVLLQLMVPDLHLGKLAWADETGYTNYDSKEAKTLFREAVSTLMDRTAHAKPERILLVTGNDFFHSDNKAGTTTKGTPLDNDSRFAKMFTEGRTMLTEVITELHGVAPVTVVNCPGNHASVAEWTLVEALTCWFRNTPSVEFLNKPSPRKYYEWGQCLNGYEHGNAGKLEDLPLLMATEMKQAFGRTSYRNWWTGDKHQSRQFERMGVRVRISPALCPPDSWHSENHYAGNLQQAEAHLMSKTEGIIGEAFYTVKP